MVAKTKWTPNAFEWELYRVVMVEQQSLMEVAKELKRDWTSLMQIVQTVGAFLLTRMRPTSDEDNQREVLCSERLAAERLNYLYSLAVQAFRQSQGPQQIQRHVSGAGTRDGTVLITKQSHGDVRYLAAAQRLAFLAAKLPAPSLWAGMDAPEMPKEACSDCSSDPVTSPAQEASASAATHSPADVCDESESVPRDAKTDDSTPVQPAHHTTPFPRDLKARRKLLAAKLKQARAAG